MNSTVGKEMGTSARFFKIIGSGIIGAGLYLTIGIFLFALAKILYVIFRKDLVFSTTAIYVILGIFAIIGFIHGARSFVNKSTYRKKYALTVRTFLVNFIIAGVCALITYAIVRRTSSPLSGMGIVALLCVAFVLCYFFSANIAYRMEQTTKASRKKTRHKKHAFWLIVFNPIFVIIYFWLFTVVAYQAAYVMCGVAIVGVDTNPYTANTANLEIRSGERIISIDNVPVYSLNEIRTYINTLDSTKEIVVETDKSIYYVKTYQKDGNRYLGLILQQAYCARR